MLLITKFKILVPSLGQSMFGHFKYVAGWNYGQTNAKIDGRTIQLLDAPGGPGT